MVIHHLFYRVFVCALIFTFILILTWHLFIATRSLVGNGSSIAVHGRPSSPNSIKVALASLIRDPPDIVAWLTKHRSVGISHFFIRLEDDRDQLLSSYLSQQPDITLFHGSSSDNNNYENLIDRQKQFVNMIIKSDKVASEMDWIFHIDCDELFEVSSKYSGDIRYYLASVPRTVHTIKLVNVEAVYDKERVQNGSCFESASRFLRCDKGASCKSYVNGKAGARLGHTREYVELTGPHDFGFYGSSSNFPEPRHQDVPYDDLHVLHFDSCTLKSWFSKFYNLSKNQSDPSVIPFPYYRDSITAIKSATDVFIKYKAEE